MNGVSGLAENGMIMKEWNREHRDGIGPEAGWNSTFSPMVAIIGVRISWRSGVGCTVEI
jgi:hypothetical protein